MRLMKDVQTTTEPTAAETPETAAEKETRPVFVLQPFTLRGQPLRKGDVIQMKRGEVAAYERSSLIAVPQEAQPQPDQPEAQPQPDQPEEE